MERRWFVTWLVAIASVAAAAGCGPATVPLPVQGSGTPAPSTVSPSMGLPDVAAPDNTVPDNTVPSTKTAGSSNCMGAVIYRVSALDAPSFKRSVCIAVGGVVRVENLGPGNLSIDPADRVSCWYEGGITECRLIRTGSVTFKTTGTPKLGPLKVTVAEASSPPKPSPACLSATTHTIDASDGGPPWAALCVKLDVILRVENLGPEGFSASPANMVSCVYEAGVRECRFLKAGTMTVTTTRSGQTRSLILVVVK